MLFPDTIWSVSVNPDSVGEVDLSLKFYKVFFMIRKITISSMTPEKK